MAIYKTLLLASVLSVAALGTLSACNKVDDGPKMLGPPELHGDDPKAEVKDFTPKYIKIIYFKFGGAGGEASLIMRHASFDPASDVSRALEVMRAGRASPGQPTPIGYVEGGNDIEFRSKQTVFVVIDNQRVGFQNATPLSFTPYGANEAVADASNKPAAYTRQPNKTFYNAELVPFAGVKNKVLKFDNFFRDVQGNDLGENPGDPPKRVSRLAMNFNLNLCSVDDCDPETGRNAIPLVIDPDTGNGFGTPPPP